MEANFGIQHPPGQQAAPGFEPGNNGFANRRLRPLGYAARTDFGGEFTAI